MKYEELKSGVPLKNKQGEIVKCDCGGTYKWDGGIKLSYPVKYIFVCDKCKSTLLIGGQYLFPEKYPEFINKNKNI